MKQWLRHHHPLPSSSGYSCQCMSFILIDLANSACIAHNTTILTEHTSSASSQASSLASVILPKIGHTTAQKLTYIHGANFIHYIAEAPSDYASNSNSAGAL